MTKKDLKKLKHQNFESLLNTEVMNSTVTEYVNNLDAAGQIRFAKEVYKNANDCSKNGDQEEAYLLFKRTAKLCEKIKTDNSLYLFFNLSEKDRLTEMYNDSMKTLSYLYDVLQIRYEHEVQPSEAAVLLAEKDKRISELEKKLQEIVHAQTAKVHSKHEEVVKTLSNLSARLEAKDAEIIQLKSTNSQLLAQISSMESDRETIHTDSEATKQERIEAQHSIEKTNKINDLECEVLHLSETLTDKSASISIGINEAWASELQHGDSMAPKRDNFEEKTEEDIETLKVMLEAKTTQFEKEISTLQKFVKKHEHELKKQELEMAKWKEEVLDVIHGRDMSAKVTGQHMREIMCIVVEMRNLLRDKPTAENQVEHC